MKSLQGWREAPGSQRKHVIIYAEVEDISWDAVF